MPACLKNFYLRFGGLGLKKGIQAGWFFPNVLGAISGLIFFMVLIDWGFLAGGPLVGIEQSTLKSSRIPGFLG